MDNKGNDMHRLIVTTWWHATSLGIAAHVPSPPLRFQISPLGFSNANIFPRYTFWRQQQRSQGFALAKQASKQQWTNQLHTNTHKFVLPPRSKFIFGLESATGALLPSAELASRALCGPGRQKRLRLRCTRSHNVYIHSQQSAVVFQSLRLGVVHSLCILTISWLYTMYTIYILICFIIGCTYLSRRMSK